MAFFTRALQEKRQARDAPRRAKFRARRCKLELGRTPPSGLLLRLEDLPAAVHAGLEIDVVGPAQLTRILVLDVGRRRQRIGGAAHPAPRRRCFAFRNGHVLLSWSFGDVWRKACAPAAFESRAYRGSRASMPGPRTGRAACASPTLAELLMPLPAANPFSTMRASLRWYSSEELEDGVTYGGQSWLRRGSVDSFFSALLLRDGDAAGRRKASSS